MKKIVLYILFIIITILSCEDVIDVDIPNSEPRLVIEASINWLKETSGNEQTIKLTLSAPYFNNEIPPATGASITVSDTNNNTFNFIEKENTGIYQNTSFVPIIGNTYNLNILYNNETYTATEVLKPVTNINYVEQKNNGGFSNNEIELKAYYTDPPNVKNYYLFEFKNNKKELLSLDVYDDEFTDGNNIFAFYSDEDLSTGDSLIIKNQGVSKQFYEYMLLLSQQISDESGGPFETQPATVRGNCINITNPNNYPFGYFRISQSHIFNYTVK